MDYQRIIKKLELEIKKYADPKTKAWWENYIKHDTVFRGVGIPKIRELLKRWYIQEEVDRLPLEEQMEIALLFLSEPYAEDKLAGILLLQLYLYEKLNWKILLKRLEEVFSSGFIYDWNICDWLCVRILGPLIEKNGMPCAKAVSKWKSAESLWMARSSIVAFAYLMDQQNYTELVLESSTVLIQRTERFAKTGVGWILRELSKVNKERVEEFIGQNEEYFSKESLKNAKKYF